MFFTSKDNLPRQRAKEEAKALKGSVVDAQEVIATLTEQNMALTEQNAELTEKLAGLQADISDAQEVIASIVETETKEA